MDREKETDRNRQREGKIEKIDVGILKYSDRKGNRRREREKDKDTLERKLHFL